jgi:hypothetical protein
MSTAVLIMHRKYIKWNSYFREHTDLFSERTDALRVDCPPILGLFEI